MGFGGLGEVVLLLCIFGVAFGFWFGVFFLLFQFMPIVSHDSTTDYCEDSFT